MFLLRMHNGKHRNIPRILIQANCKRWGWFCVRVSAGILASGLLLALTSASLNRDAYLDSAVSVQGRETRKPIWAAAISPLERSLHQPDWTFRSSLPYRGLAAAASIRPDVVLATYEDPKTHYGASFVNAKLAMEALDGMVIPPRTSFSFNTEVGKRSIERGYQPGPMFSAGNVVQGVGGGVCIASTALYNAALLAGMSIVERHMHSGAVSYASAARDAAVVYGQKDLVIKNDFEFPVWVRAIEEDGRFRISLLSTRRPPFRVVLREIGTGAIPPAIQIIQSDVPEPVVIREGTSGCDLKLIREYWQEDRLIRKEQIAHDVRSAETRIVHIPAVPINSDKTQEPPASTLPDLDPVESRPEVSPISLSGIAGMVVRPSQ